MRPWIILLLLLVPAAEACSLSKEPPAPAVFYVWDTQNDPVAVAVHARGLGGTCELSNLNAVDDERFAWVERSTIHVLDLETRQRSTVPWSGDHPQDLAVVDGEVWVREMAGPMEAREHKVWRVADDGTRTLLHTSSEFAQLHGQFLVTDRDGVGIVDARTGKTVLASSTAQELGYPGSEEPSFLGTDGRFLVYDTPRYQGHDLHIHDLQRDAWRTASIDGYGIWMQVADGHLYSLREGNLTILDLASGAKSTAGVPQADLVGAGGGHVVLGAYSAASVEGTWRAAFADHATPLPWWIGLVGLVWIRRLRRVP